MIIYPKVEKRKKTVYQFPANLCTCTFPSIFYVLLCTISTNEDDNDDDDDDDDDDNDDDEISMHDGTVGTGDLGSMPLWWDPHRKWDINAPEKVQSKVTHWDRSRYGDFSVSEHLRDLKWQLLADRRRIQRIAILTKSSDHLT